MNAKIAVGGSGSSKQLLGGLAYPRVDLEVGLDLELGVGQDPGRRQRGAEAAPPVLGRVPSRAGR